MCVCRFPLLESKLNGVNFSHPIVTFDPRLRFMAKQTSFLWCVAMWCEIFFCGQTLFIFVDFCFCSAHSGLTCGFLNKCPMWHVTLGVVLMYVMVRNCNFAYVSAFQYLWMSFFQCL